MQQTLKAGRQQAFKASRHEALNTGWRTCETFNRGRDGRYAPDASFVCWNFHPPAGLDVWSFWGRLCDRDVAFSPQSHRGVFPLLFLKAQATTGTAMFIAIGNDEADVAHLKAIAEEALRELPDDAAKDGPGPGGGGDRDQFGTLNAAERRIWFLNTNSRIDHSRVQQR